MSVLPKEHDILVKDLEHCALLCVMVKNHCEGSPLMEQCDGALIKCDRLVPYPRRTSSPK